MNQQAMKKVLIRIESIGPETAIITIPVWNEYLNKYQPKSISIPSLEIPLEISKDEIPHRTYAYINDLGKLYEKSSSIHFC